MKKYIVKICTERIVEAENKNEADEKFKREFYNTFEIPATSLSQTNIKELVEEDIIK